MSWTNQENDDISGYSVTIHKKPLKATTSPSRIMANEKTGDIVPLTFPKIKPVDGIGMYLISKVYEKEPKRYPQWDLARESISIDLIVAKRAEYQSIKRLHDKRQLSIKKRESFNQQYKDLEEKEALFQQSFKKFNKFVRENQEKRERAEKKIVEEQLLQEKRESDIVSVKENIIHLTNIKAQMDQRIKEYRMFDDYLQSVVRLSSNFKNISDIIVRYEALTEAKNFLGERQNRQLASLENARADMAKLLEDKNLVLIGLNNQLLELQGRYDSAKGHSLLWETLVSKIQDISIRTIEDLTAVKTTCWDTYRNMCTRKDIEPKCSTSDLEGQLVFIKKTLHELKSIYNTAKTVHIGEINSIKGEMGSKPGTH